MRGRYVLELARWGLRPVRAKAQGPRPINAHLETIATNGIFRGPFSSGRAVVPLAGYYGWVEADDGGKGAHFIHHPDGQLRHTAGLTPSRKAEDCDGWDVTCAIVTRHAERMEVGVRWVPYPMSASPTGSVRPAAGGSVPDLWSRRRGDGAWMVPLPGRRLWSDGV